MVDIWVVCCNVRGACPLRQNAAVGQKMIPLPPVVARISGHYVEAFSHPAVVLYPPGGSGC